MYQTEKGEGLLAEDAPDNIESDKVKIGDFTLAIEL